MNWKTSNYLLHRWIGITLGVMTFVWFGSGIAMMYYPWPAPTASEELARRPSFAFAGNDVIGFDSAIALTHDSTITSGRLMQWNGHLVYALHGDAASGARADRLLDATTGRVLSPITAADAVQVARSVVANGVAVREVRVLSSGDHYLLSGEYRRGFPAYVIRFADRAGTAIYVSRAGGYIVGVVTDRTRWTTWLGTVPHWLYFKWLYTRHFDWWLWVSYVLPAIAMIAGLSGITIGVHQLLPHWRRGNWRVSAYRGASQWHHIAGIVFGAFVVTWSLSGLLEVLGPDASPTTEYVAAARGPGSPRYAVDERAALASAARSLHMAAQAVAIDRTRLLGSPGYVVYLDAGHRAWVDGATGIVRADIGARAAADVAARAIGFAGAPASVTRLSAYDTYYYARFHREMPLPAYRVAFADADRSVVYLDPVSGEPTGFVNDQVRRYRWMRDGLHSWDLGALNAHRALWQAVVLPFMLGGTLVAATGLWLVTRRLRRMRALSGAVVVD